MLLLQSMFTETSMHAHSVFPEEPIIHIYSYFNHLGLINLILYML